MKIEELEKNNNVMLSNELVNEKTQQNFLETTLGKAINTAVDMGIRAILPNFVEDQVINIKDNLLNYGLKEGITKTIDDTIDLGKSVIGIFTGNFENVGQMQKAIESGGLIDGVSSLLDVVLDNVKKKGAISTNIANKIKNGKNVILNNLENNIEKTFNNQYKAIDNINKSITSWKKYFNEHNFNEMEKEYKRIEKQLKEIAPIEKTISNARTIETLHNLIKNNGKNFNLTKEQLELAEKLSYE